MAAEFTNPEHLVHLISQLSVSDEEKELLKRRALSPLSANRLEAIKQIEQEMPGSTARLAALYPMRGKHAIFLWEISALHNSAVPQVRKTVRSAIHRSMGGDVEVGTPREEWTDVGSDDKGERARVLRAREPEEGLVEVVTRLTKDRSIAFEGDEQKVPVSADVALLLEQWDKAYIARVLSSQQDARKSAIAFTEWLTNQEVPSRAPHLYDYLRPLTFTEKDILKLAANKGLDEVGFHCEDPRGVIGEMAFYGKTEGHHLQPLDLNYPLVKTYNAAPQDIRTYNYTYVHPEGGFPEKTRVSFFFKSRPAHLTFDLRTSHPAASTLIHALYNYVRP